MALSFRDFFESFDLRHASQQMDSSSLLRGFHHGDSSIPHFDEMTLAGPQNGDFLLSGFQTSQFRNACVSCPQDSRNAESRCADWLTRSRPCVSSKWTAPIVYGVFTIKKPDLLSLGFAIYRIVMHRWTLPFQDFSRALGFTPCVPGRWTILVVSRFRDLRLQISLTT
jgi:hypothetical protein